MNDKSKDQSRQDSEELLVTSTSSSNNLELTPNTTEVTDSRSPTVEPSIATTSGVVCQIVTSSTGNNISAASINDDDDEEDIPVSTDDRLSSASPSDEKCSESGAETMGGPSSNNDAETCVLPTSTNYIDQANDKTKNMLLTRNSESPPDSKRNDVEGGASLRCSSELTSSSATTSVAGVSAPTTRSKRKLLNNELGTAALGRSNSISLNSKSITLEVKNHQSSITTRKSATTSINCLVSHSNDTKSVTSIGKQLGILKNSDDSGGTGSGGGSGGSSSSSSSSSSRNSKKNCVDDVIVFDDAYIESQSGVKVDSKQGAISPINDYDETSCNSSKHQSTNICDSDDKVTMISDKRKVEPLKINLNRDIAKTKSTIKPNVKSPVVENEHLKLTIKSSPVLSSSTTSTSNISTSVVSTCNTDSKTTQNCVDQPQINEPHIVPKLTIRASDFNHSLTNCDVKHSVVPKLTIKMDSSMNCIKDSLDSSSSSPSQPPLPKLTIRTTGDTAESIITNSPKSTVSSSASCIIVGSSLMTSSPPTVPKLTIKAIPNPTTLSGSNETKFTIKTINPPSTSSSSSSSSDLSFNNNEDIEMEMPITPIPKFTIRAVQESESFTNQIVPRLTIRTPSKPDQVNTNDSSEKPPSIPKFTIKSVQDSEQSIPKLTISVNDSIATVVNTQNSPTQSNEKIPKLTIRQVESEDSERVPKLMISVQESESSEKIPKLTIKQVQDHDSPEKVPKLTIKQVQDSDDAEKIPKLTIKQVTETPESNEKIPKLTIKQVTESLESNEKIPKLTIKQVQENDGGEKASVLVASSKQEPECSEKIPKITIKHIQDTDDVDKVSKLTATSNAQDELKIPKLKIRQLIDCAQSSRLQVVENQGNLSKITIKTISEDEPLEKKPKLIVTSAIDTEDTERIPKLTIKQIQNPDDPNKIPKLTVSQVLENDKSQSGSSDIFDTKQKKVGKLVIKTDTQENACNKLDNDSKNCERGEETENIKEIGSALNDEPNLTSTNNSEISVDEMPPSTAPQEIIEEKIIELPEIKSADPNEIILKEEESSSLLVKDIEKEQVPLNTDNESPLKEQTKLLPESTNEILSPKTSSTESEYASKPEQIDCTNTLEIHHPVLDSECTMEKSELQKSSPEPEMLKNSLHDTNDDSQSVEVYSFSTLSSTKSENMSDMSSDMPQQSTLVNPPNVEASTNEEPIQIDEDISNNSSDIMEVEPVLSIKIKDTENINQIKISSDEETKNGAIGAVLINDENVLLEVLEDVTKDLNSHDNLLIVNDVRKPNLKRSAVGDDECEIDDMPPASKKKMTEADIDVTITGENSLDSELDPLLAQSTQFPDSVSKKELPPVIDIESSSLTSEETFRTLTELKTIHAENDTETTSKLEDEEENEDDLKGIISRIRLQCANSNTETSQNDFKSINKRTEKIVVQESPILLNSLSTRPNILLINEESESDCMIVEDCTTDPITMLRNTLEMNLEHKKNNEIDSGLDISSSLKSTAESVPDIDKTPATPVKRPRGRPRKDGQPAGSVRKPQPQSRRKFKGVLMDSHNSMVDQKNTPIVDNQLSTEFPNSTYTTPRGGYSNRRGRGRGSGGRGRGRGRGSRPRGRGRGGISSTPDMRKDGEFSTPVRRKKIELKTPKTPSTIQLFEEDTRMSAADSISTPARQSELINNDDTQSSILSTNSFLEGSSSTTVKKRAKMEVTLPEGKTEYTVDMIAEYDWPPPKGCCPAKNRDTFMIQEQIAQYLGIKSFKRKYPDLQRRQVDMEERNYLQEKGLVTEKMCDLGITAVWASDVLDIMYSDFYDKYEEYKNYIRQKQVRDIEAKQKALAAEAVDKSLQARERALQSAAKWNCNFNKARKEDRRLCLDLQNLVINLPSKKLNRPNDTHIPPSQASHYPIALVPGQFAENYRSFSPAELRCYPLNTILDPFERLRPKIENDRDDDSSSDSESESGDNTSSSDSDSRTSSSDSDSDSNSSDEEEKPPDSKLKCYICHRPQNKNMLGFPEVYVQCTTCRKRVHPYCIEMPSRMAVRARNYNWQCADCKCCIKCKRKQDESKMLYCEQCDRGYHIYCIQIKTVPEGRWHCERCAICMRCGSTKPEGNIPPPPPLPNQKPSRSKKPAKWTHEYRVDHITKLREHSSMLCAPCARLKTKRVAS